MFGCRQIHGKGERDACQAQFISGYDVHFESTTLRKSREGAGDCIPEIQHKYSMRAYITGIIFYDE